jgi:hypothetical protein
LRNNFPELQPVSALLPLFLYQAYRITIETLWSIMKEQNRTNGIAPYGGAAGGWGALKAVADAIRGQMSVKQDVIALFKVNQPQGFDCPGCAWPDPQHASSFEFCDQQAHHARVLCGSYRD